MSSVPIREWTRARLSISFDIDGGYVYSSRQQGEAMNLFRMPISPVSIKPAGDGVQLTFGTALERFPSVANGRIAFASQSENVDVWFVSGDTNSGGEFKASA